MSRIAILSDSRLATAWDAPFHGLGKAVLTVAEGLAERGHEITLYAAPGSKFTAGQLVIGADETEFMPDDFDAVLDNTHQHTLQDVLPDAPIVNISHDREALPGRCAVYPSEAHKRWHMQESFAPKTGRVIYNAVNVPDMPDLPTGDYFAFISMFHAPKAPIMAREAARLAGVELVMAGSTPPAPPTGVRYIGTLTGLEKYEFLARAKALIHPASTEAGPVTPLEAQAVGCPVIVSAYGAAHENMQHGLTGYAVEDTLQMADAIKRVHRIKRVACRQWVADCRPVSVMIDQYEKALHDAMNGEVW